MAVDYDALIEQLAFGKSTPKLSSCIGIYLSPDVVYLCETHMEKGKPAVDNLIRVAVPAPAPKAAGAQTATTLNTDFLAENDKLSGLIRQAMSQNKWRSQAAIVTLSHHIGLLRYFTMPAMDRRYWASAVPMEAKKYIPIPFDVLSYDYQVTSIPAAADGKPRQGALVAVSPRKNLPNVAALCQALDLRLLGMEVAPCSVMRLWSALDGEGAPTPTCQAHFDGGAVRVVVGDQGLPVLCREVFLGAEASPADSRKVDLGGCAGWAQKQLGVTKIARARVSGSAGTALSEWKEVFSQELGMPVEAHDPAAALGIKSGDWGSYAAVGSSLRYQRPSALTIDLGEAGRISEGEKRTARDILVLAGIAALFLALGGLWQSAKIKVRMQELRKYKRDADMEAVFQGKSADDVRNFLGDMQTQADVLSPMEASSRVKVTDLLREITAALPEKVWLTGITVSLPLKNSNLVPRQLRLTGHAAGATLVEERDLVFQFRDRLSRSPLIAKIFKDIEQPTVTGRNLTEEAAKGLEQDALKQALEKRTEFEIALSSKRK